MYNPRAATHHGGMLTSLAALVLLGAPAHEVHEELTVRAFVLAPMMTAFLKDPETEYELEFKPNAPLSAGARVSYAGYGLAYAHPVDTLEDEAEYGESDLTDLQIYSHHARFGVDAYYQRVRGFFLSDPAAGGEGCEQGDPCALRPKLEIQHVGLNGYYVWDPDFSLSAAFDQGARQLVSAGSFLLLAGLNRVRLANPGPIAPPGAELGPDALFREGTFYGLAVAPGYGHTFVWDDWFVSPALFAGLGLQYREDRAGGARRSGVGYSVKANLKMAAGYNGEDWLGGLIAVADGPAFKLEEASIQLVSGQIEIFIGRRF